MDYYAIIFVVVAVIALVVILIYNSLVSLKNQVKNAWAQIDVQLKRRNDLIPNLVETVKGYMKHEKGLLTEITKARSAIMHAGSIEGKAKASNELSNTLKTLFSVSENYPQLKASENFLQLQEEISGTENKIAYSRQYYNDTVMVYNTRTQVFPTNLVAMLLKFGPEHLFEAQESERKSVRVEL